MKLDLVECTKQSSAAYPITIAGHRHRATYVSSGKLIMKVFPGARDQRSTEHVVAASWALVLDKNPR